MDAESVQLSRYPISKQKVMKTMMMMMMMMLIIIIIWSKSSQAVRLLICFREIPSSDLDRDNDYHEFFCGFPLSLSTSESGHNRFHPHPFELSVHYHLIQQFPNQAQTGHCGSKSWAEGFRH
jgi:hypothetical protein